jgi:drug/metabolite transporter (DMT)-like permease
MAIFGWSFLNEKMVWRQVLGIFVAVIGVLVVVSKGDLASLVHGGVGTRGDFLVMLSAPNWAVFSILSRRGLRQYPATWMMFYVMGFGWLFSTVLLLFTGGFGGLSALKVDGWLGIAFLGFFCSGLAYIFWYDALKVLSSAEAGAFIYLEPIVTVLVAAIVIPEPLQTPAILGGIAILVGVWIVNHPTRKN